MCRHFIEITEPDLDLPINNSETNFETTVSHTLGSRRKSVSHGDSKVLSEPWQAQSSEVDFPSCLGTIDQNSEQRVANPPHGRYGPSSSIWTCYSAQSTQSSQGLIRIGCIMSSLGALSSNQLKHSCMRHTIRTSLITPHHFFRELISVIVALPITPSNFWRFDKRNSQEKIHLLVLPLLGRSTPPITPKYSQIIN